MGTSPSPYQMVGKKERDSTQPCVLSSIVQSVGFRPCRTPSRIGTANNKEKEMREILFRAKERYSGAWVYGALLKDNVFTYILNGNPKVTIGLQVTKEVAEVLPETVGQFTGLTDKNGTMIFEGDIVECHAIETTEVVIVEDIRNIPVHFKWVDIYKGSTIEIIGNIHDNPELLEEKTC